MNQRRIYIAGPMTGYRNHNFPAFHDAAARFRAAGWVSPPTVSLANDGAAIWFPSPSAALRALSRASSICHSGS